MHGFAAAVALFAFVLYADRSGWLFIHGTQSRWAVVTRAGIGGLLMSLIYGFIDLARHHATFELRHWLVLGALALTVAGHLGLRHGDPAGPQSPS